MVLRKEQKMNRIKRVAISFLLIATVLTGRSAVASYAGEEAAGSLPELDQQIISEDSSIDGGDTNGSAGGASDGSADTADDNQEQAGTALSSMQACLEEAVTLDTISGADAMSDQGHQDSSSPGEEKKTEESGNAGTEESIDGGTAAEGSQEETGSEDKSAEEEPDQNEKADNTNGSKETDDKEESKAASEPSEKEAEAAPDSTNDQEESQETDPHTEGTQQETDQTGEEESGTETDDSPQTVIPDDHEHELQYIDQGDGSHLKKCKGQWDEGTDSYIPCGYEETVEEHAFDPETKLCVCNASKGDTLIYRELSEKTDGVIIEAKGPMPENARLVTGRADKSATEEMLNESAGEYESVMVYAAYDIKLMAGEEEYQPADYEESISIRIAGLSLDPSAEQEESFGELRVTHIDADGNIEQITGAAISTEEVSFETGGFSTFVINGVTYDTEAASCVEHWRIGFRGNNAVSEAYSEALFRENANAYLYYRNGIDTAEGYTLVIAGSGNMAGWLSAEYVPWKDYSAEIYEITVESSITRIGMNAFAGTGILTAVLPQSISEIDSAAFAGSEVIGMDLSGLQEGVKLGADLFKDCRSLTCAVLPEDYTTAATMYLDDGTTSSVILPASIFEGCTALTSLDIPESVRAVGYRAVYGCSALTKITGAENVSFLPMAGDLAGAFYCPETIETEIDPNASACFKAYCFGDDNRNAYISWNVGYRGNNAVDRPYERSLYGSSISANFFLNTGMLDFAGSGSMAGWYEDSYVPWAACREQVCTVRIDERITNLGRYALAGTGISEVSLPYSISEIGDYAFSASALESIDLSGLNPSVKLSSGLFKDCTRLNDVTLPEEYTTDITYYLSDGQPSRIILPAFLLEGCTALTSLDIPAAVAGIGVRAVYGCQNLTLITGAEGIAFDGEGHPAMPEAGPETGAFYVDISEPLETIFAETVSDALRAYCFADDNRAQVRSFSYTISMPAYVNAVYDTDRRLFNADIHARLSWVSRDTDPHMVTITSPEQFDLTHTENASKTITFTEKEGSFRSYCAGSVNTAAESTEETTFSYQSESGEYDPGDYSGNATFRFSTSE